MSAHQKGLEAKDSFFVNRERGDYGDFDSSRMLYPQDSTGNDDEDMPGRKEDENGLGEEAGEKERSKFPYDCGRPGRPPDLSFSYAMFVKDKAHPRKPVKTDLKGKVVEYEQFKLCQTRTGTHLSCLGDAKSEFLRYGIGISLYFKFLKYMVFAMAILSIVLVPHMITYYNGGAFQDEVVTQLDALTLFTLGNLGRGSTVCRHALDGETIEVTCPEGSQVARIEAFYGLPSGRCDCPAEQRPSPECPGTPDGSGCSPSDAFCHLEERREIILPEGDPMVGESCCSNRLRNGQPDFRNFRIRKERCNSGTVDDIAQGKCLNRRECSIRVDPEEEHTWEKRPDVGIDCENVDENDDGECTARLDDSGLDECSWDFVNDTDWPDGLEDVEVGQHRMVVVAQCYEFDVKFFDGDFSIARAELGFWLSIVEVVFVVAFFVMYHYLRRSEVDEIEDKKELTAADYTVFVPSVPDDINVFHLERELRRVLKNAAIRAPSVLYQLNQVEIADVNFGSKDTKLLDAFIKRGKLIRKLDARLKKQKAIENSAKKQKQVDNAWKSVKKIQRKIRENDAYITALEQTSEETHAVCAYVTFEDIEGTNRAKLQYPDNFFYWCCQSRSKRLYNQHRIRLRGAVEPSDVKWENLPVSTPNRLCRQFIVGIITIMVLVGSALLIFFVEDERSRRERAFVMADCGRFDDILNKTLVVQDEFADEFGVEGGQGRLGCFCQEKFSLFDPSKALDAEFDTPDGVQKLCRSWFETFFTVQFFTYGSAMIILTINFVFRVILKQLTSFEKIASKTGDVISRALKLFILQLLNTAGRHRDFNPEWYDSVGVSITVTMMINIVAPHVAPILKHFVFTFRRCHDRGCSLSDTSRTKCVTQNQLNRLQFGPEMLLDERYAQAYNVIFVCTLFATGIPLLIPIAMVSFFLSYWVDKFFFIKIYRTPPAYATDLATHFTSIMPYAMILHLLFGAWMLSNTTIFPPEALQREDSFGASGFIRTILEFLDEIGRYDIGTRLSQPGVYIMAGLFVLLILWIVLSRVFLVNIWKFILSICPCLEYGCTVNDRRKNIRSHEDRKPKYFDAIPTDILQEVVTNKRLVKPALIPNYKEAWEKRLQDIKEKQEKIKAYDDTWEEARAWAQVAEEQERRAIEEQLEKARLAREEAERMERQNKDNQMESLINDEAERRANTIAIRHIKGIEKGLIESERAEFNSVASSALDKATQRYESLLKQESEGEKANLTQTEQDIDLGTDVKVVDDEDVSEDIETSSSVGSKSKSKRGNSFSLFSKASAKSYYGSFKNLVQGNIEARDNTVFISKDQDSLSEIELLERSDNPGDDPNFGLETEFHRVDEKINDQAVKNLASTFKEGEARKIREKVESELKNQGKDRYIASYSELCDMIFVPMEIADETEWEEIEEERRFNAGIDQELEDYDNPSEGSVSEAVSQGQSSDTEEIELPEDEFKMINDAWERVRQLQEEADALKEQVLGTSLKPKDPRELEQDNMNGLHSYDIHDSEEYRHLFGLDAEVPSTWKRRLYASKRTQAANVYQIQKKDEGKTYVPQNHPHKEDHGVEGKRGVPAYRSTRFHLEGNPEETDDRGGAAYDRGSTDEDDYYEDDDMYEDEMAYYYEDGESGVQRREQDKLEQLG